MRLKFRRSSMLSQCVRTPHQSPVVSGASRRGLIRSCQKLRKTSARPASFPEFFALNFSLHVSSARLLPNPLNAIHLTVVSEILRTPPPHRSRSKSPTPRKSFLLPPPKLHQSSA